MQQKGAEQVKEKMSQGKNGVTGEAVAKSDVAIDTVEEAADASTTPSEELAVQHTASRSESVVKRTLQRGLIRKIIQRKSLLVVAVAVVLGRRLCLAYLGKAFRLI